MSRRTLRALLILITSLSAGAILLAQGQGGGQAPTPTPVLNMSSDPLLQGFKFRSIGPSVMGGRIDDIECVDKDPWTCYVGYATGGLWKTIDGGVTWSELLGEQPAASVGDVAIAPSATHASPPSKRR